MVVIGVKLEFLVIVEWLYEELTGFICQQSLVRCIGLSHCTLSTYTAFKRPLHEHQEATFEDRWSHEC
jgi:hypothetical protein